ncbi:mitochondrial carrier domain-containing protein [Scenedesmus sp. NREL 46B-D3]|nr:mitochondrial carrier domain-containing protein [Scenedesmus sp. NREL 46B-D3]
MSDHRLRALFNYSSSRSVAKLTTVGIASGVAATAVLANRDKLSHLRISLNSTLIEAVSGAAGEVAQIALVYPLDTVKVRCQAAGLSSRQVLAQLQRSTGGSWAALIAALYAGALPAVPLSVLVGAVHYVSFCTTRRALVSVTKADGAALNSSSSSSQHHSVESQPLLEEQQHQHAHQHIMVSHGVTGTHFMPMEDPAAAAEQPDPIGLNRGSSNCSSSSTGAGGAQPAAAIAAKGSTPPPAAAAAAAAESDAAGERSISGDVGRGSLALNMACAVITAVITAVVEAPLEQFRHNSQAGNIKGNFVREMWRVLRTSGPRSLYFGFVPYCLESWPYDVSELLVVGAASDVRAAPALANVKPAVFDMAVGALAGTVAVLVSMPFDVVKTYMQTHGTGMAAEGLRESVAAFWSTGSRLVAKGGPGALFVGLAPRLAHQVPGAMVCWLAIESMQRHLKSCAEQHQQFTPSSA